jgi:hypothetical protein
VYVALAATIAALERVLPTGSPAAPSILAVAPCSEAWFPHGYGGIVHSDRLSAYSFFDALRRQVCWAHLLRDVQSVIDAGATGSRLPARPSRARKGAVSRFLGTQGVEGTNNDAEQSAHGGVLWRRSTQRTRSPAGTDFVTRMLSATATCRIQQRDLAAFLHDAFVAHLHGRSRRLRSLNINR